MTTRIGIRLVLLIAIGATIGGGFLSLGADWPLPLRTAVFGAGNALLLALFVFAVRRRWLIERFSV